ncbi:MAG TPA: toll/interleukin-1 receptor domain-containing protein, partial [Opitutaceae bacterium]|nr:toll/interleukin-1 receptor domain-containing protein [Opitutaceae bacterium]
MMGNSNKAVFLSYASQDAEAARRICQALRLAGVEVWFDQSELVGGDAWDQKIRSQIRDCALLVPVISKATQARREAYFRLEWRLADERTYLMAKGTPFLLPVTIDETNDRDALVPDSFLAVQWTRLRPGSGGQALDDASVAAFCARVRNLLTDEVPEPAPQDLPATTRARRISRSPRWLRPVLASAVLVIAVLGFTLKDVLKRYAAEPPSQAPVAAPSVTIPLSEARQLARKAEDLMAETNVTTEKLAVAWELCDRALALDTTDAKVWATASIVDTMHVFTGFDRSETRRQQALRKAARAMALAPGSPEARWANAYAYSYASNNPAMKTEALTITAGLVKERPGDRRLLVDYGTLLREARRYDEAAAVFERLDDEQSAGWNYFSGGRIVDARR